MTDTPGLLLAASVHPAGVQDRDGAEILPRKARRTDDVVSACRFGRRLDTLNALAS